MGKGSGSNSTYCKRPKAAVPNLFGSRDQFRGRQFLRGGGRAGGVRGWGVGGGSGGNVSDGEPWGAAGEASLPPHARFLLCDLVPNRLRTVPGLGVGDPCPKASACCLLGYANSTNASFKTLRVFTSLPASQMPEVRCLTHRFWSKNRIQPGIE